MDRTLFPENDSWCESNLLIHQLSCILETSEPPNIFQEDIFRVRKKIREINRKKEQKEKIKEKAENNAEIIK